LNPGRRGGKPATTRLSYGAAVTTLAVAVMQMKSGKEMSKKQINKTIILTEN
jgi:hypothetical protein